MTSHPTPVPDYEPTAWIRDIWQEELCKEPLWHFTPGRPLEEFFGPMRALAVIRASCRIGMQGKTWAESKEAELTARVDDLEKENAQLKRQVQLLKNGPDGIWRCFQCDEVFETKDAAERHFGRKTFELPACRLDDDERLKQLRHYQFHAQDMFVRAEKAEADNQALRTALEMKLDGSECDALDAGMDNVIAWRLGEIAVETVKSPAGDLIDRGLILCRILREKGFEVRPSAREQIKETLKETGR